MAYKIKRICAKPFCNNYATHGAYCDLHKKEINRSTTSKHASYYLTTWWKKNRKDFLTKPENFYCKHCLEKGIYTPADTVHHSKGYNSWETFCDRRFWEAWNKGCHSSYHTTITNEQLYEQNKENW